MKAIYQAPECEIVRVYPEDQVTQFVITSDEGDFATKEELFDDSDEDFSIWNEEEVEEE